MTDTTIIVLFIILLLIGIANILMLLMLIRKPSRTNDSNLDEIIETLQAFSEQLREFIEKNSNNSQNYINSYIKLGNDNLVGNIHELGKVERDNTNSLREQVNLQLSEMRTVLQRSLVEVREDSAKKLDNIKKIVDETLANTLEERLNKSYQVISERLEAVAKGFGEMQKLATGVSDLNKVFGNVKSRGVWGEVMLGTLLEQILTTDQFRSQVSINGGRELVDFAVILPGKHNENVLLPIDSKFPDSSYQRMLDVVDKPIEYELAAKNLINDLKKEGKSISEKYIKPPLTTDFAIMYLPTEGLFAEAVKREGLSTELQNKYRVIIAGPTTLSALLSSLQMGFRTLAIEKRSMEIRDLLITFKMEFIKFSDLLGKTQKKLEDATKGIDDATKKTKIISRKLEAVESITDTSDEDLLITGDESDS